ncbi:hypothetical protein BD770DRAFT_415411 [Pilaira anomala]|nr:hypothetical protein BD770DRAFT_415411 [Pilaira anomala]
MDRKVDPHSSVLQVIYSPSPVHYNEITRCNNHYPGPPTQPPFALHIMFPIIPNIPTSIIDHPMFLVFVLTVFQCFFPTVFIKNHRLAQGHLRFNNLNSISTEFLKCLQGYIFIMTSLLSQSGDIALKDLD